MFSRDFSVNHKMEMTSHCAFYFTSNWSKQDIIKAMLKADGVSTFLTEDNPNAPYGTSKYNDGRINNLHPKYYAGCCSFTKNASSYYLFPIHEAQLKNVGLTSDDLLAWINWLNGARMGFEYYYLGQQPVNKEHANKIVHEVDAYGRPTKVTKKENPSNDFHWIMVPAFATPANNDYKKTYVHWIALRWLINTRSAGQVHDATLSKKYTSLPYYIIPRVAMMLNEDFGLSRCKSFMFAQLTSPFYYYYSILPTSNMIASPSAKSDVMLTGQQFHEIIKLPTVDGSMNNTFTPSNCTSTGVYGNSQWSKVKAIKDLTAPYDIVKCIELFSKADYAGFIKYIQECYNPKKVTKAKSNAKKSVNK